MRRACAAIFAALFIGLIPAVSASADEVTLTSRDGAIALSGTLLGFDGEFYRMETRYGELTVDGSGVICEGSGCPSPTEYVAEVTFSGSGSLGAVLMPALVEAFALKRGLGTGREEIGQGRFVYVLSDPATGRAVGRFTFRVGAAEAGFADLLSDEADIAMSAREIREIEVDAGRAAGLGTLDEANRSRVLALDALVPVVAPQNPVDRISMRRLAAALGGEIDNWADLDGPDAPVTVHLLDEGTGLTQSVADRILTPDGLALRGDAILHATSEALTAAVANDPSALGITRFTETGNTKLLPLRGPCGFALAATRQTIKTEDYPLTAPAFLYLPARRLPVLAREFLSFTRSDPAQIVIRRAGFVDQAPEEIPVEMQGDRFVNAIAVAEGADGLRQLKRMVSTLGPMQRLSTSFRFEPGSARLDAQSRSNVYQLAQAIETGRYDGRRMLFVGFSDGLGPRAANLGIARDRAGAVRDAVMTAAETVDFEDLAVGTEAFGEAMPMACDDTVWGRGANRRVEVWVR